MRRWFLRSRRDQQPQHAGLRPAHLPTVRSSRFELLEDRRLLTVSAETLHSFSGGSADGSSPQAALTLVGSTLFGTTEAGGGDGDGTVFSVNTDGSDYQVLYTFTGATDGANPVADLTLVGSTLVGTTENAGSDGEGTVFSIDTDGGDFQVMHWFGGGNDGENPAAGLTLVGSTLYGTTQYGGADGQGTVFSIGADGSDYQILHDFGSLANDGQAPAADLTLVGSTLFGTTQYEGNNNGGTIFSINTDGSDYQSLYSFGDTAGDGLYPMAGLTLVGSTLFGTNAFVGTNYGGTIFSINTDGSDYQVLHSFSGPIDGIDGAQPEAGLTLVGATLFGTAEYDGYNGGGTVFSINTNGSGYQTQYSFGEDDAGGRLPDAGLTLGGSTLYGTTFAGGSNGAGMVFSIPAASPGFIVTASGSPATYAVGGPPVAVDPGLTVGSADTDLTGATVTISSGTLELGDQLNFTSQNGISGSYSAGELTLSGSATVAQYQAALQSVTFSTSRTGTANRSISIVAIDGALDSNAAAESVSVTSAPATILHSFGSTVNEMSNPVAGLTLVGSTLFGVTAQDGSDGDGTIFSMNTDGSNYQIVHTFAGSATDGANPFAGLTLVGSTLYGTTYAGGSDGNGTIFSIDTDGSDFQVLHSFVDDGTDGQNPFAGLTLDGSTLLGTTQNGGSAFGGTIFSIHTDGSDYQVLHAFQAGGYSGSNPVAGLALVGSTVYGTTQYAGSESSGTVFAMNANGSGFQVLHAFEDTGTDGQEPTTPLTVVGSTLIGTTEFGGNNDGGTFFSIHTDGSDYQSLDGFAGSPFAGLTLVGSTLYGTTPFGGSNGDGTVFSVNPDGSDYQIQYSFGAAGSDGQEPASDLTLVGSTLYGVTLAGGSNGDGAIFSLSGLTPNFLVTASGGSATYDVGGPAVAVDSGVMVTSAETDLTGATVTISPGTLESDDLLGFVNQNGISGSYAAGELTLSGGATPAQYQAALQSITFSTTSTSTTARSISIVALDGDLDSNAAAEQVVIESPVVTPSGTTNTYLVGGVATPIDAGLAIGYDQADLTGATMTISAGTLQSGDTLNFTNQNGISGSYAAGVLTLSGTDTVADYQGALQSVTFSSTSTSTTTRSFSIVASDGVLDSNAAPESVTVGVAVPAVEVPLQTIYTFNDYFNTGGRPYAGLTAVGSTLFGTTENGGSDNGGTIFSVNADGSGFQLLHTFTGTGSDGANPYANLTLVGSTLFGTTEQGGSDGDGTIFSIHTDGTGYRVLYSFTGTGNDGAYPFAGLTLAGSTLYGTASHGGTDHVGIVFSIDTDGTGYQVLHSFLTSGADGEDPVAGMTLVGSTLFGTTEWGGSSALGTIFSINTDGSGYQVRYSFYSSSGEDGIAPTTSLTLAGSTLFGTTFEGGSDGNGTIFSFDTSDDSCQSIYSFAGDDGNWPTAGLTLVGSTLYGTTITGGSEGFGTIFSINTDGSDFSILRTSAFANVAYGSLTLVGSTLFGTTGFGAGTIYSISDLNHYTARASPMAVDPGVTVTLASTITDIDGATVTISPATFQPGDTLHFADQSGISGSYGGGVLTLSGSATPAQYQAALESVTFSSTSTSLNNRAISTVTFDDGGAQASNMVSEQVIVAAPITVTGAWVKGSTWGTSGSTNFLGYLASHSLGSATLGYALKTGASQLTVLPWANINTISVQFSAAVSNIGLGSLALVGGTGGGATGAAMAPPSVTGFTSDGNNTYSWTLSANLTNNKYVFAIATTGSSFGTPDSTQVTDTSGAGISGSFATASSTFPSGNGLAGSTFDFAFNVLPGDGLQNGIVSVASTSAAKALNNDKETAAAYNPYYDYNGAGIITVIDASLGAADNNDKQSSITAPTAPSASHAVVGAGSADFTALAIAVQEAGGSTTSDMAPSAIINVVPASAALNGSGSISAPASASTAGTVVALPTTQSQPTPYQATDEAVADFDLADLYV